jgi:hypothetical protein
MSRPEDIKPGDLCQVLREDEAWKVSDMKYEDWLSFDKKRQNELVLVLEVYMPYLYDRRVLVANSGGKFFISSKFLRKV